jgi:hypothetical protein
MAKVITYLRVAKVKKGYKVIATSRPNILPIQPEQYIGKRPYPTISFAIELNIPDDAFAQAAKVIADVKIPVEDIKVTAKAKGK